MLPDSRFLNSVLGEPLGLELQMTVAIEAAPRESLSRAECEHYRLLADTPRAASWLLGRTALKRLREKVDGRSDVDDLEFPSPQFSLTHSSDVALAVADASGQLAGIGIDLEMDTIIRPEAARFFLTGRERQWLDEQASDRWRHHVLRLWCLKEALYKSNPDNAGTILGDCELLDPAAVIGKARVFDGPMMEYASWQNSRTCIALAVCRRRH